MFKSTGLKVDSFIWGSQLYHVVFELGNLSAADVWARKTIAAFQESCFASTRNYSAWSFEVGCSVWLTLPIFVMMDRFSIIADMTTAAGFMWDDVGYELYFPNHKAAAPSVQYIPWKVHLKLMLIVCTPDGEIDATEANDFMPSPTILAQYERESFDLREWGYHLLGLGARAFRKLGRDDEAYETATIAVSPEQQTAKRTTLVDCYSILGQIAAARGNLDEAEAHFASAMENAKLSRLPMLELLAARDWKRYVLQPNERDCSAVEAAIDGACAKMKKTRERMGAALQA